MSYSPTNSDATAVSTDTIARLNATSPTSSAIASDQSVALADAMLRSVGFQAQSNQSMIADPAQSLTTFSPVGNGSSTGFARYTFAAPVAKTYLVHLDTAAYLLAQFGVITYQVANITTSVNYTNATMQMEVDVLNAVVYKSFRVPVAMNAGSNALELQWKCNNGTSVMHLDAATGLSITVTG